MPTPYEILTGPVTLWVAPVGTAFPLIDAAPAPAWVKIGTSGNLNYMEDGVRLSHPQTTSVFRSMGDSGPRKVFRTEEDLILALTIADLTLEQYAAALNENPVTDAPPAVGVAGFRKVGLSRGLTVAQRALLLRFPSPYGDGFTAQYEVPLAFQTGQPEVVFQKGEPAGLALEWTAIVDPNAVSDAERFGRIIAQDAAAL